MNKLVTVLGVAAVAIDLLAGAAGVTAHGHREQSSYYTDNYNKSTHNRSPFY